MINVKLRESRIIAIIKLSKRAFGKYKIQILILTILGFISGLLEGIGVNALIPLFSFVVGGNGGNDIISKAIESFFSFLHISFNLKYLLIFISILFFLKAIVLLICSFINIKITTDYERNTRNELFNETLKSEWSYLLKQKLGFLETVLITDITFSSNLLLTISKTVIVLTSLLIYTAVAINISFIITLITLILGGILFLAVKPLIYKTRIVARETANANKEISHHINENVLGMKTIKSMSVGGKVAKAGDRFFVRLKNLRVKNYILKSITGTFLQPISVIFVSIIFAVSYKITDFNFAVLIAVIYLIQRIFQYIQNLQINLHVINESVPYLQSALAYKEKAVKYLEKSKASGSFNFNNSLELNNINFSYNNEKDILSGVSFKINKGEMVGLVGPSGAGKTTIVDLILRLFTPKSGEILLDGKNADEVSLKEWRKNIGYVSQDIFLMNDTILNNIKFYDDSIKIQDIEKAAKMANIYDFIKDCPDKFNTVIGERGVLLSAGQRQRIVIARVLARNPKILILDEATSALDNESELKIQQVIENLKGKITVLAVAHRLSTVMNSDKLVVLEGGRIIEQDDPQKLLKNKESYFYKVYNIRK